MSGLCYVYTMTNMILRNLSDLIKIEFISIKQKKIKTESNFS